MSIDLAKSKNIEIKRSFPENLIIMADRNMIRTVLRNLVSNAIKFTHKNGKIEVKAITDNQMVEISVVDNGVGMSKDTINKLFRIDSDLSTPGTENEKGTGLGLVLCKEFIEKHGSRLLVESELARGSTFRFSLPLKTT
jgi:signal transduction histidine kinase